jgi:hypothetical protein
LVGCCARLFSISSALQCWMHTNSRGRAVLFCLHTPVSLAFFLIWNPIFYGIWNLLCYKNNVLTFHSSISQRTPTLSSHHCSPSLHNGRMRQANQPVIPPLLSCTLCNIPNYHHVFAFHFHPECTLQLPVSWCMLLLKTQWTFPTPALC